MSGYRTGYAVVEETAKRNAEAQQAGNIFHAIEALRDIYWKNDGDKHIVRFLSDEIVTFPIHEAWKTVDGKYRNIACTAGFPDGDKLNRPCVICANYKNPFDSTKPATPRLVSLAIVLEQEKEGKKYIDSTRELELLSVAGDLNSPKSKGEQPIFGLVKQGNKFWNDVNGYYSEFDTTVDRPYSIIRRGVKKDTTYTIAALNEDTEFDTPQKLWDKYDIPEVEGFKDPIVGHIVKYLQKIGSQAWIDRWLGTGDGDPTTEFDHEDESDEDTVKPAVGSSLQDRLNAFKAKGNN